MKNMDGFIIEARQNGGGGDELPFTLGEAMGSNRPGFKLTTEQSVGNGALKSSSHTDMYSIVPPLFLDYDRAIEDEEEYALYDTDAYETKYGSRIVGKPVAVLWSVNAGSGGDILGHAFCNQEGVSTDLGNGVTCSIVGNGDGRLFGFSSVVQFVPTGSSGFLRATPSLQSTVVSPFGASHENLFTQSLVVGDRTIVNQYPETAPTGGPLDGWVESDTGYYPAVGLAPYPASRSAAAYAAFNSVIGTPDNNDSATWHDPWLEEAILKASV